MKGLLRASAIALLAMSLAPVAGAASRAERIEELETQVATLQQQVGGLQQRLDSQGLLEMSRRIDALQEESRRLRGEVERLQHELTQARAQQREQYLDLDRRLQVQELQPATAPAVDPQLAYQSAFDQLKQARYDEAAIGFRTFLDLHAGHELASNAQYWLGEVYYVKRDYPAALTAFQAVLSRYSNARKAPDAMLKAGFCQDEMKQPALARATLEKLIADFPGSTAATEASQRLRKLAAEGR